MLINELLETTVSQKQQTSTENQASHILMDSAQMETELLKERGKNLRQFSDTLNNRLKGSRQAFETAIQQIPTGWRSVFQDVVRS